MSVLLDTGVLLGMSNEADALHEASLRMWDEAASGRHGRPLSLDAVYVEAMNFLARKPRTVGPAAMLRGLREDRDSPVGWIPLERDDLVKANGLFFRYRDAGLAMTDCLLAATAQRLGAKVATHDRALLMVLRPAHRL